MGASKRRRPVIRSRKRTEDEGEEEGGILQDLEDDSLSEVSVGTDADDDADGEASDDSRHEGPSKNPRPRSSTTNGQNGKAETSTVPHEELVQPISSSNADTEVMMNGLQITKESEAQEIDFEDTTKMNGAPAIPIGPSAPGLDHPVEARRKEHEEYRKRRDADPAFVPNRGGFFMHDQRSGGSLQNGFRGFGRGAARGRSVPRGSFHGMSYSQLSGPADKAWSHDLHDSVAGLNERDSQPRGPAQDSHLRRHTQSLPQSRAPNRDFSITSLLGDMQIRLFISGMTEPKDFTGVKRFSYTQLPFHRPPLRRDKPVRISIPNMDVKYIFPSPERSFIFIPRALRPNQQGFGKIKGRSSFGANYVGYGPLSSRRTSFYGGSAYSPSAAISRRSSIARDFNLGPQASPSQVLGHQQHTGAPDFSKPIVRLPPSAEPQPPQVPSGAASVISMTSGPNEQQRSSVDLPMHHPKPERSLQVSEIVAPTATDLSHLVPQQQPFHQQVPIPMASHNYANAPIRYPHSRHPSHPSQTSTGTPLPQIPEAAIHAQPFQPYGYPAPQGFYPQQYPLYFYPPTDPSAVPQAAPASFAPSQPFFYPVAVPSSGVPAAGETGPHGGMVAQEAGGMVFYSYPTEPSTGADPPPAYQPSYPAENMVPSPFYGQAQAFYPPPPPPPMQ